MINCCFCGVNKFKLKFIYNKKPKNETYFGIKDNKYKRCYIECLNCNHYYSIISFNLNSLYSKKYSESTYGKKIYQTFKKIINLPTHKSDNSLRIKRFEKYFKSRKIKVGELIDIGSGTGIFPYSLTKKNLKVTCLEPDKNLSNHLRKNLKLNVIKKNLLKNKIKKKDDVVTLNKVLEHIDNPFLFMNSINKILKDKGTVYIEVPDTISASKLGYEREEFFVEHIHGFSKKSLKFLFDQTNFKMKLIKNIREPSGKFTTYCFLTK